MGELCEAQGFPSILYSKAAQHEVLPQLVTMAGVLSAVPLDSDSHMQDLPGWQTHQVGDPNTLKVQSSRGFDMVPCKVVLNAGLEWAGLDEVAATEWVFDRHGMETTGVTTVF